MTQIYYYNTRTNKILDAMLIDSTSKKHKIHIIDTKKEVWVNASNTRRNRDACKQMAINNITNELKELQPKVDKLNRCLSELENERY